jgi:hypothetical protein
MRLGVIADIHGNELALRAVLEDAASRRVDRWWVLGDLVLFGPRPAEVLDLFAGLPGVRDLRRRRHPNAAFVESALDGRS